MSRISFFGSPEVNFKMLRRETFYKDSAQQRVRAYDDVRSFFCRMRPVHFGRAILCREEGRVARKRELADNGWRIIAGQLSRLGNNLNQLVMRLHMTGEPLVRVSISMCGDSARRSLQQLRQRSAGGRSNQGGQAVDEAVPSGKAGQYKNHAYRFVISDKDLSKLPVTPYDPTKEEGPLRQVGGVWYWNSEHTAEFLLDSSLVLHFCKKIDFVKHHEKMCAAPGGCGQLGQDGTNAAGRVLAFLLSRDLRGLNVTLIVTAPKTALSTAAERGILKAYEDLSRNLGGPAKSNDDVDAALRAALLQLAAGEETHAQATAKLIRSDDLLCRRLAELVKRHFKVESTALKF